MMDQETGSLWSHILGQAMRGDLEGTELEIIPAEMVTWEAWQEQHPQTTVLNLSRIVGGYTADFYDNPPSYVYGWMSLGKAYSVAFDVLMEHPVLNLTIDGWPSVVTFDPASTAAHILSSRVDGTDLYFAAEGEDLMIDQQTGSVWNRNTGIALEGPLKGENLQHQPGIVSYKWSWRAFHPDGAKITDANDVGPAE